MQNENRSDMSWKDKLQDIDSLSDVKIADKNIAWEKLHERMQDQPKRIKAYWYWLAAACVLAAVILPFSFNKKTGIDEDIVDVPSKSTSPKSINKIENNVLTVEKNEQPLRITKNETSNIKDKRIDKNSQLTKQIAVIEKLNEPAIPELSNIITDSPSIKKLPAIVTASAPVKKKLKVVHVNELGEPIPELNSRTSVDDYSVIQFGVIKQQAPTNTGINQSNHNSIFSKQKNTSN